MADGDAVVTMDADLQHPPQLLIKMLKQWENGYDVVYAYREKANIHAKAYQKITSKLFYKVINLLSDIKLEDGISDYRLIDQKVVEQLKQLNEYELFFRGMIKWVGFKQIGISYNPAVRLSGQTSYSAVKLFKLALNSTMSFSVWPLYTSYFYWSFFLYSVRILYSICFNQLFLWFYQSFKVGRR